VKGASERSEQRTSQEQYFKKKIRREAPKNFLNTAFMQIQIFYVPVPDSSQTLDEMNRFLRSYKIIDVDKQFVASASNSFWTFCIRYISGEQTGAERKQTKVDYKEILDEATFAIYSRLRECRKMISEKEAVPVYAVFTNEELANIARLESITPVGLLSINGIGKGKVEKFGKTLIELYQSK